MGEEPNHIRPWPSINHSIFSAHQFTYLLHYRLYGRCLQFTVFQRLFLTSLPTGSVSFPAKMNELLKIFVECRAANPPVFVPAHD